ncbi:MAG: DNA repair protein RecN [Clostridia bacterium]|nr:DNA repair protein RecN [Clostridia bacterium]
MLKFLHIENIAVIEKTDIEFKQGFNVLTGETGAGKSIIIDSINAVLGERTSKDLIRTGCDSAVVTAVFDCLTTDTLSLLEESGIAAENGEIIITRKLSLTSKGFCKINNIPVTTALLREIAGGLINIHGQHDNQALLNPDMHLSFIDAVAENDYLKAEYYTAFKELNTVRKELQSLEIDEDEKQRKIDTLKYQINELESADIKVGEYDRLKTQLTISETKEKTFNALNSAEYLLSGTDDTDGAITQVNNALKLLQSLKNESFNNCCLALSTAITSLEDARAEIDAFTSNSEYSELNPNEINLRLDLLSKLMVKYGSSEEKMLEFLNKATTELENITLSDKRIAELSLSLENKKEVLISKGEKLTLSRKRAGEKFAKDVSGILEYLNMPNIKFEVSLNSGRYTKNGCDTAEFLISANNGESLKPLHKIASGGELSRVMLSIKSVLLNKDNVGTMIFDEIDAGISGFTAGKVANQLKKVADNRQVISVTHLAQIAAIADEHLLIEKTSKDGHTYTNVTTLNYDSRINEIARIMSGTQITENLYNSAKELIDRSNLL